VTPADRHRTDAGGRPLVGLLLAEVVSTTGTEMTAIALPWFVLVSTGSPTRMGAVLAAEFVGIAVLGLWGGRVATVLGPRSTMLASDLARAALVALVPLLVGVHRLSFPVLLLIGLLVGAFFPAYSSSQRLLLAAIVRDDELRLTRAGGLLGAVNETASTVGPALGGILVVLIGPVRVLLIDAVSYLVAVALIASLVRSRLAPAPSEEGGGSGVQEGLSHLLRDRFLRRRVLGVGLLEVAFTAMVATFPVLALDAGSAAVAGWLLGSFAAGSVAGGLLSSRARRVGGGTAVWSAAGIAGSAWLLVPPTPLAVRAAAVALGGLFSGVFFPRFFAEVTLTTPPRLRARVMTTVTVAIAAPAPLGFLGAGLLAQRSGSTLPSLVGVAVAATSGALLIWSRSAAEPIAAELGTQTA
jgi:hypothetical protein